MASSTSSEFPGAAPESVRSTDDVGRLLSPVSVALPDGVLSAAVDAVDRGRVFATSVEKMGFVLELTEWNIAEGGGPFGAAIFDDGHRLVAPGVNRVVAESAPVAHAEIVAIAAAGKRLGTWDLAKYGRLTLATSTEPCAMCLGAVPWSGVGAVVIGCRDGDARRAGFDEGHKPDDWIEHLEAIGIDIERDVERHRAAVLLSNYADGGGDIYNGRRFDGAADAASRRRRPQK